jgi:hypothetical protein
MVDSCAAVRGTCCVVGGMRYTVVACNSSSATARPVTGGQVRWIGLIDPVPVQKRRGGDT